MRNEEMFWDAMECKIKEAARASFEDLLAKKANENFYVFALYTDSSAMTVCPAANSSIEFKNRLAAEGDPDSKESTSYYQWVSSAWAYEGWKAENFGEISKSISESDLRTNFGEFKRALYKAMVNSLAALDLDGFFGTADEREKVVIFVTVTDDDEAEGVENATAKVLNPESVYQRFVSRYD